MRRQVAAVLSSRTVGATLLFLPGLLALGCSSASPANSDEQVRVVQFAMEDIAFSTSNLSVSAGEVLRLEMDNQGRLLHDFTIDDIVVEELLVERGHDHGDGPAHTHAPAGPHLALEPNHDGVLQFRAMSPGEYQFYCTVAGHREAGMRGTLVVS